jgi:hypothetical protein
VILAHIKKEGRDRKNSGSYVAHLGLKQRPISGIMARFLGELRELNQYNSDHLIIIDGLEWLMLNDDRPHDGLIGKLVDRTNLSRVVITTFLKLVRLRSFELSDSILNHVDNEHKIDNRKHNVEFDEE